MKIETKFNVGDEVWIRTLKFNKKVNVIGITINIRTNGEVLMEYGLESRGYYYTRRECDLFPTKEELIKSL